jgi:hypothetical protein
VRSTIILISKRNRLYDQRDGAKVSVGTGGYRVRATLWEAKCGVEIEFING